MRFPIHPFETPDPTMWPEAYELPEHFLDENGPQIVLANLAELACRESSLEDLGTPESKIEGDLIYARMLRMREVLDCALPKIDDESWFIDFAQRRGPLSLFTLASEGVATLLHQSAMERIAFRDLTSLMQEYGDLALTQAEGLADIDLGEQHHIIEQIEVESTTIADTLDLIVPRCDKEPWRLAVENQAKLIIRRI